jgi:hypothetical protein
MSYTEESIKNAVEALRENHLIEYKTKLKPTHAHEIVSAYLGYNSKIALKSDESFFLDPEEPATFEVVDGQKKIKNRLGDLNGVDVSDGYSQRAERIISSSIKPECTQCGSRDDSVIAAETDDYKYEQLWVCHRCASRDEDVGYCRYCGEDSVYPIEMLNSNSECPEHRGESIISPEDQEGWDDNIQKWNEM